MPLKITTRDLHHRLAARYAPPEWVFMPELANRVGYASAHDRALHVADAVAFSPWPSRGLAIHGFELKVSRADWLRELRNPEKGEGFGQYCQYWWLVIADRAMIHRTELPDTWGLLVPRGVGLRVVAPAIRRKAKVMDALLAAALLRCVASRWVSEDEAQRRCKAEFERGRKQGDAGELAPLVEQLERRLGNGASRFLTNLSMGSQRLRDLAHELEALKARLRGLPHPMEE